MANRIGKAMREIKTIDSLANKDQWVNRIHPLVKLFITIFYIILVVSFHKYNLEGLIGMFFYPIVMFFITDLSVKDSLYRLRIVLPLVCIVGIFNPAFDRQIIAYWGSFAVTGGFISMLTLMMKGVLTVLASYLLVATTSIDKLCHALRMIHVPRWLVTQLLLIYRYISVLLEEANKITQAYALRAPGQKGVAFKVWGSLLGQLLIRTVDRASEIYESMCLRGFTGEFKSTQKIRFRLGDAAYLIIWSAINLAFFLWPVLSLLSGLLL